MHFVPIKSADQQAILMLHKIRELLVQAKANAVVRGPYRFRHPEVRVARCQASRREPRRMSGPGLSPFEGR
ncbi:hypothetical protein ABIB85_008129 [Bradyrhizobium sp. JR1.5]